MNSIYRTTWGAYIDLSKIVSIEKKQDIGNWSDCVIHYQLMEKPVCYDFFSIVDCKVTKIVPDHCFNDLIEAWRKFKGESV